MKTALKNTISIANRIRMAVRRAGGLPVETDIEPYNKVIAEIRRHDYSGYRDGALKEKAKALRLQAGTGEDLESLLPVMYALAAEICVRTLGIRPYDTQLAAGIALHRAKIAQMETGEGKTLAAVFPACLNGLTGKGVHILTANDYLARRDAAWMGPVYDAFGLTVSHIDPGMSAGERRRAYGADITYLTAREAGFDLLRDGLCRTSADRVQRPYHYVLIDEADFILIDEARVPLVIAGPDTRPETDPCRIDTAVRLLKEGADFLIDQARKNVHLTQEGMDHVEDLLGCGPADDRRTGPVFAAIHVSLQAHHLLARDVDYIVRDGKIGLVDEFTGRIAQRRRWPYGIQNALEAKERLRIEPEGRIYGSITMQHFIALYPKAAAMTATALPAALEFERFYGLATVVIPPVKPLRRIDFPDRIYATFEAKRQAVIKEVKRVHATGQPVLVGTATVRESEALAADLAAAGVTCNVLNAKNDEREASLVAQAGTLGAVTIATNMAGRGTDILLGGPQSADREKIAGLGGLYVIGTNRHASVRIDHQLRGRAGRQGDPGESRFFLSLEDPLMEQYGVKEWIPGECVRRARTAEAGEEPLDDPRVEREIARAQRIIAHRHFQMRHLLRKYSGLVERQRLRMQSIRAQAVDERIVPEEIGESFARHLRRLERILGREEARERLISLFIRQLDGFWADHLLCIDDIKECLPLQAMGREDPFLFFLRQAGDHFTEGLTASCRKTEAEFLRLTGTPADTDGQDKPLNPGNTWTYLLNDEPLPLFKLDRATVNRMGITLCLTLIGIALTVLVPVLFAFLRL